MRLRRERDLLTPRPHCAAFLAASLDGFIAREDGRLDWLPGADPNEPRPDVEAGREDADDGGYAAFVAGVDLVLMGRGSFDAVLGFGIGWPYELPVRVLTHRPMAPPEGADVAAVSGALDEVLQQLGTQGVRRVYLDGGDVVAQALRLDVLDELTITRIPVVLGTGISLFGPVPEDRWFTADAPRTVSGQYVQTRLVRDRTRVRA